MLFNPVASKMEKPGNLKFSKIPLPTLPITQNLAGPATQFYRGEKDALLDALRSCPAGLDWPIVGLFDELMAHNPDARVLLNIGDSGEVWVRSFREQCKCQAILVFTASLAKVQSN